MSTATTKQQIEEKSSNDNNNLMITTLTIHAITTRRTISKFFISVVAC